MKKEILVLVALLCAPFFAHTDTYPSKPIRLVVPYAAGGAMENIVRPTAQKLSEILGQPVIVDNRPGAAGMLGAGIVAKLPADGYSILGVIASHYSMQYFVKNVPLNMMKDFTPIVHIGGAVNMLAVHPSLPVHSVKEFIEYAKKNPNKLFYGTSGVGTSHHLAGMELSRIAGINMVHVPYKGGGSSIVDVVGGQIPIVILTASTILPFAKEGKLRPLGLTGNKRTSLAPEIPTIAETVPSFVINESWGFGIVGPANLPRPIVEKLNAAFRQALHSPELKQRLEARGNEITANTSADEFTSIIIAENQLLGKVVSAAGIKPE